LATRPPTSPLFPYTTLFRSELKILLPRRMPLPIGGQQLPLAVRRPVALAALARLAIGLGRQQQLMNLFVERQVVIDLTEHGMMPDRKSTRLNSSHVKISYAG